jgi:hypothetical protein
MLSKDHFSNVLNAPAGQLAGVMLQYVAPRVIYAWDHPEVPEQEIMADISRCFHHPATRDSSVEIQRTMFSVVEKWSHSNPAGGKDLNQVLSSESVRAGKNHVVADLQSSFNPLQQTLQQTMGGGTTSHSYTAGGVFNMLTQKRELEGESGVPQQASGYDAGGYQQGYESRPYEQQQQQQQYPGQGGQYGGSQPHQGYQQGGGYGGYGDQQQQQGYDGGSGYGRY